MNAVIPIDTIAQVTMALVGLVGLPIIWRQLYCQNKHTKLDALTRVHEEVGREEFRDALEMIFAAKSDDLCEPQSRELFNSIRMAAGLYDLLGAGVQEGIYPKKAALKTEWKILIPLWKRLEGFVQRERSHRGGLPYKEHFEFLAKEAEKYWKRHYPGTDPFKVVSPRESAFRRSGPKADDNASSRLSYQGRHLLLFVGENSWEYVSRKTARRGVTIVPVTCKREIVFVEQYRVPLRRRVIELPAGLVGDEPGTEGESVEDAVRREVREETGFECKKVSVLRSGPVLPGITDEINTLCFAELSEKSVAEHIVSKKKPDNEPKAEFGNKAENERIVVHSVPLNSVLSWITKQAGIGKEIDLKIYAGLFFLNGNQQGT